jgi:hypothetical protein
MMQRTVVGFCAGLAVGEFILAGLGAWWGFVDGVTSRHPNVPPGWQAAGIWAFVAVAYFWWLFGAVGGAIGAIAAFGSWLVRPKSEFERGRF